MKKILLINPHETKQSGFTNPPLGLLYIAGMLLKYGFNVKIVDGCLDGREAIFQSINEFQPEMIGITCLTPGRKKALEIVKLTKRNNPSIITVMGGVHPTIMYRQILKNYLETQLTVKR